MVKKMNGDSLDLNSLNIYKLKKLFPEVLSDGNKIDFDKLKELLSGEIDDSPDRYNFTWNGKKDSIRVANESTTGTLLPKKDKSKNWNDTENLYVEGDNLETLKILQKSYINKIDFIYIDPPYNTGKDFIYKDNFKDDTENYFRQTGQLDENDNKTSTNSERSGRYHTNWLNMIYPRLLLARNLMSDNGIIFISIDDIENANLKKVCDEIFGSNNFIGNIIIDATPKNDPLIIATSHEYVLAYVKNMQQAKKIEWGHIHPLTKTLNNLVDKNNYELSERKIKNFYKDNNLINDNISNYKNVDKNGIFRKGPIDDPQAKGPKDVRYNPITNEKLKTPNRGWSCSLNTWKKWEINDLIYFPDKNDKLPSKKTYLNSNKLEVGRSVLKMQTRKSTDYLNDLFGFKAFDHPKPIELIEYLLSLCDKNVNVLDFFSGSSTTADAVMRMNSKDNGKRRFIMVQLPEKTKKDSELYKNNFKTISSLGIERIKRSGVQIKENSNYDIDDGLKVFELNKSNIKEWNTDPSKLLEQLDHFNLDNGDNWVKGRNNDDVVYELLLKQGLELTDHMDKKSFKSFDIYNVDYGSLIIILGSNINEDIIEYINEQEFYFDKEFTSFIFQDTGFDSDPVKLNIFESLKNNGYKDENIFTV